MVELTLIGREYEDIIIDCEDFVVGETNNIIRKNTKRGGMFNMPVIDNIDYKYHPCGFKQALVINNINKSDRTSFTQTIYDEDLDLTKIDSRQWCHVMYIDDISHEVLNQLNKYNGILSIDFCKTDSRTAYTPLMSNCQLIFDSRERSSLWQEVKITVPVILHDPYGCDCYYNGTIMNTQQNKRINDLRVNGAGDIFAAIFINQFYKSGLERAMLNSCEMTTLKLLELNEVQ